MDMDDGTKAAKGDNKPLQVVIVGGGPAGLLLAHYLLDRGKGKFRIRLCEQTEHPREVLKRPLTRQRYSVYLSTRALLALKGIDGLLPRVIAAGDVCKTTYLYDSKGKVFLAFSGDSLPKYIREKGEEHSLTLLIDRMELCGALLDSLLDRHGASGLLDISYSTPCSAVDLRARTVNVGPCKVNVADNASGGAPETWSYDLLVGADGVNSLVRNALARGSWGFDSSMDTFFGGARAMRFQTPANWEPHTFHIYPYLPGQKDVNAFIIPDHPRYGTVSAGIIWHKHKPPTDFLALKDAAGVKEFLKKHLPAVSDVPDESAAQLLETTDIPVPRAVKCSRYHDSTYNVVLIGDAAHATYPNIGQGCNAALSEVTVLARLLLGETVTKANKSVDNALTPGPTTTFSASDLLASLPFLLPRYSALQVRDGHALVNLSYSLDCFDKGLRERNEIRFALRDVLASFLAPWMSFSVLLQVQGLTVPYADIWDQFKSTLEPMRRANEDIKDEWRKEDDTRVLSEPLP